MADHTNAAGAAAQGRDGSGSAERRNGKSRRGFAAMSPERQREIASQGGRAAHQKGTAHQFTSEEAARAGRKGGLRSRSKGNREQSTRETGRQERVQPQNDSAAFTEEL